MNVICFCFVDLKIPSDNIFKYMLTILFYPMYNNLNFWDLVILIKIEIDNVKLKIMVHINVYKSSILP